MEVKAIDEPDKHESKNPILKFLNKKFYEDLNSLIEKINVKEILDVGCGIGFVTNEIHKKFRDKKIEGIDIDEKKIQKAKSKFSEIKFSVGSIFSIPKVDNSYELVVSTETLEHLEKPEKALLEITRVSKKYIIVSVPREPYFRIANVLRLKYLGSLGNTPGHINNWPKKDFESFLNKYLVIKEIKTSTFWIIALCEKTT